MKIICIDNKRVGYGKHDITIGNCYDAVIENSWGLCTANFKDDNGYLIIVYNPFTSGRFKELKDYRNDKINDILS